jgi:phosphatidylglycerophosphatase C
LTGLTAPELESDAEMFAAECAPALLRPDALAAWRRWRAEGARLVIVSASPSIVVAPFAERLGADQLIATELAYDAQGQVSGAFQGANCRGAEKIARLKAAFGPDLVLKAAYGDTAGDKEMLALAEIKGFKLFKAKP